VKSQFVKGESESLDPKGICVNKSGDPERGEG
jgi:hypothetical protein